MKDRLKIIAFPNPSGSRQYRLCQIAKYINQYAEDAVMVVLESGMTDHALQEADVIVLQGTVDPKRISQAWAYASEFKKLLVTDLDDYPVVPPTHLLYEEHQKLEAVKWTTGLLKVSDLVTTTTPELAEVLKVVNPNVEVLPNCLDMDLWGLPKLENTSKQIRLAHCGSATHREDMEMVKPAIMEILKKYPNVKFLYCGDGQLWKDKLFEDNPQTEYVEPTSLEDWPAKFRSLRIDIGVVPLLDTEFNRGKSNLKFLENAAYKIPCVLSPTVYSNTVKDGETGLIARTPKEFVKQLSYLIENPDKRAEIGQNAYDKLHSEFDIANKWQNWLNIYRKYYEQKQK
jgi:glycosyltransferase involved in cell wall biosynthesis